MSLADDTEPPMRVLKDEPMRRHTSWRVGGPADIFFSPATIAELERFLSELPPTTPIHWIGLGSNLLVRDGGVRGAVVSTAGLEKKIERIDGLRVRVSASTPCATLARQCVRWHLGPAAFFAGIPGTVGGALAMNAGAFGGETWSRVESVETIDRSGHRHRRSREQYRIGYRSVAGREGEWFIGATLIFESDPESDKDSIRALLRARAAAQPLGVPSCGSVFRNPPGQFAGQLVEEAGLKGAVRGGAQVSDKHANFIINTGAATAADIEGLIEDVRTRVKAATGVDLELEVRLLGEPA
jgi:UDP-N-acetylmuramate dehydrogenase